MERVALGLMSGTSCDGVSAALVAFHGRTFRLIAQRTRPYPRALMQQLLHIDPLSAPALSALNMALGERFAESASALCRLAGVPRRRVAVIGSHGHTIYHGPRDATPSTLQVGAPAVIAQRTGIPVAADFRTRDLAAGGQGAPLIPFFDEYFFGRGVPRALQNIGGIANVTLVGRGLQTHAFDTGPGNVLLDAVTYRLTRGRLRYDRGGRLARRGRIDWRAVHGLWADPYFRRRPPKSTGRELFNLDWLRRRLGTRLLQRPLDLLATLTYFTAYSIAESYRRFLPLAPREVIVSGGGAHNRALLDHLTQLLAPIPVSTTARYGLPVQAKEPVAFAFFGLRALQHRLNHAPSATGARTACVLGAITPGAGTR